MTRLRVDFEVVEQSSRGTTFHRSLAVVVGVIAVLATVLALLQTVASQQSSRANHLSTRISAQVTEGVSVSQAYSSYVLGTYRETLAVGIGGNTRAIQGLQNDPSGVDEAVGTADVSASDRLGEIVGRGALLPEDSDGPHDPHTAEVLRSSQETFAALLAAQDEQRELARRWSGRSSAGVLGLTLLTLAGVLTGLSAILGEGRAGYLSLASAAGATLLALGAGVLTAL